MTLHWSTMSYILLFGQIYIFWPLSVERCRICHPDLDMHGTGKDSGVRISWVCKSINSCQTPVRDSSHSLLVWSLDEIMTVVMVRVSVSAIPHTFHSTWFATVCIWLWDAEAAPTSSAWSLGQARRPWTLPASCPPAHYWNLIHDWAEQVE